MFLFQITVHASDRDESKNGEIRYSLDTSVHDLFSINPFSGWITNLVALDRELQSMYVLDILATDNGTPAFNSSSKVYVNLVDSNDNPSVFTQKAYVASGTYFKKNCDLWPNAGNAAKLSKYQFGFFFIFWNIKVYISRGIGEKNFSEPYSIIWKVWKWGKNRIFVEVGQKVQKRFFYVLLSYLRVWLKFQAI